MVRIGVNGFGRIGRYFTRLSLQNGNIDVAVVNDLADIRTLAHLFKYDSVHGGLGIDFEIAGNTLVFANGKKIIFTQKSNPAEIPWGDNGVSIVIESTGLFRTTEKAGLHLSAGAEKVIISAPAQDNSIKAIVLGVNHQQLDGTEKIISNASCTTNSAAPMIAVIKEMCRIKSAYITTVHSYTSDQRLHDAPHNDLRRARAAAESIVPITTGAAKAITRIFPELEGTMGGCGIRVPVPNGSLTDLTITVQGALPSPEEINAVFKEAASHAYKGIIQYIEDPIVSADIIGNPYSCVFDSLLTSTVGDMIKLVGWYDNEAGYSNRLLELVQKMA
jgi:glyceraldehyde 3-phosphate dehydrogenase